MDKNLLGLGFALLSAVSLGVSNFLYKRSSEVLSPINTTFFYYSFSFVIALIVWWLFGERERISGSALIWPLLIAVFLFTSVLSFNYAVMSLDISLGATIRALSFIVTALLGVLIYKEILTYRLLLALFLMMAAVLIAGTEKRIKYDKVGGGNELTAPSNSSVL